MNQFHGSVLVPKNVATGKANITISFPSWKEGNVLRFTGDIQVVGSVE